MSNHVLIYSMNTTILSSPPTISVPYIDLAVRDPALKKELLAATDRVLSHGQFILGEEVERFEQEFAAYIGARYAVGTGNCTDALVLTLQALGIGPGDEVITAPNSFLASASCAVLVGATPVFVDALADFTMDPSLLEAAITPRTKVIIPVHLTGQPADIEAILAIAARHDIPVIEDAAQATGATVGGKRVGAFGRAACFSLHPLKNLSVCGDGGVITTNDTALYEHLLIARNHGLKNRDECVFWSMNSRLDALQAALVRVKLPYLKGWTEQRRANAAFYCAQLSDIVEVPRERPGTVSVYHTFVIQTDRRDALQQFLRERGIVAVVHYPAPIHLQEAARSLGYKKGDFPVVERQAERILSIPSSPSLSEEHRQYVAETIRAFYHQS